MDSLQPRFALLTLYLTLTHIFSGGKAKINLHTTPLTVVMPINCLLRSFQFPSPQNEAITSCTCACFRMSLVDLRNKIVSLTYCCLVYPTFFAICLCFLQLLNFFFLEVILLLSKPFRQMMLFVTNVNEWRHIR